MALVLAILSFISPLVSLPIMCAALIREKGARKPYCVALALQFAAFGYALVTFNDNDLTRYQLQITGMYYQNLPSIINSDTELLYARDIFFYLVALTRNTSLLPFFVGLITYLPIVYIVLDTIDRYDLNTKGLFLFLPAFCVIAPDSVICNVRCIMAYSIMSYGYYRIVVEHKFGPLALLCLTVPLALHTTAIIVLAIISISFAIGRIRPWLVVGVAAIPTVIDFVYSVSNALPGSNFVLRLMKHAIAKAHSYLYWTEGGWATGIVNSSYDQTLRIACVVCVGLIVILSVIYTRVNETNERIPLPSNKEKLTDRINGDEFERYTYLMGLMCLGLTPIILGGYWRFGSVALLFCAPLLGKMLDDEHTVAIRLISLLYICSAMMFVLNLYHLYTNFDIFTTFCRYAAGMPLLSLFGQGGISA